MIDRERISDFIQSHLKVLIAVVSAVFVCFLLVLFVSVIAFRNGEKRRLEEAERLKAKSIPPEEFFLPEEPLQVPGIQLSRESSSQWTEEEVSRWYVLPSEEDLDGLRSIGENAVENLLEAVP